MKLNDVKRTAARVFDLFGINNIGHHVQRAWLFPFIRVVNYHDIPKELEKNFEEQLAFYSSRFVNVTYEELIDFLKNESWPHDKPGLILSFDDGYRSHFQIVAPLLEKYNFKGWFFVPAQLAVTDESPRGNRLTPDQIHTLAKRHVIGCHTSTHCRLTEDLSREKLKFETLDAQTLLEKLLKRPVEIFCWVGGEEYTYTRAAADMIKQGFKISFMSNNAVLTPKTNQLQLQRTNVEAENPLWLVRFQISGLMDIAYYPKRRRVNKLTA